MRRFLICGLILAAAPASAQELAFDPAFTLDCLAGGGGEACIGRAAEACTLAPDGYTTVGMGFCYGAEWELWDARLNAAYDQVMEMEESLDAEMAEIGATVPKTAPALRDMQRAWIVFRDAACDYERAQWGGGTGQGPATAACLMTETARQTLRLEARLASMAGR